MSCLTMNLKVLLWKCKGELSNRTYEQYMDHVAHQCCIENERFRACLVERESFKPYDIGMLREFFADYGYDLTAIEHDFLFRTLMDSSEKELVSLNLRFLLDSLGWGENCAFVDAIGVNPSTLSRWKQGKTLPDRESQLRICKYFGYSDNEVLKTGFLFLNLEPVTSQQKRQECKDLLDGISNEDFDRLYPALIKLLR